MGGVGRHGDVALLGVGSFACVLQVGVMGVELGGLLGVRGGGGRDR